MTAQILAFPARFTEADRLFADADLREQVMWTEHEAHVARVNAAPPKPLGVYVLTNPDVLALVCACAFLGGVLIGIATNIARGL